jgi:hypothetical protein
MIIIFHCGRHFPRIGTRYIDGRIIRTSNKKTRHEIRRNLYNAVAVNSGERGCESSALKRIDRGKLEVLTTQQLSPQNEQHNNDGRGREMAHKRDSSINGRQQSDYERNGGTEKMKIALKTLCNGWNASAKTVARR